MLYVVLDQIGLTLEMQVFKAHSSADGGENGFGSMEQLVLLFGGATHIP